MSGAWRQFDLRGGGLQGANLEIARRLRKRGIAYALAIPFPLGLHCDYLGDSKSGWCYRGASVLALAGAWMHWGVFAAAGMAIAAAAVLDVVRMESRIAAINKRIRMEVYLRQTDGAPRDFAGHHLDEPGTGTRPRDPTG